MINSVKIISYIFFALALLVGACSSEEPDSVVGGAGEVSSPDKESCQLVFTLSTLEPGLYSPTSEYMPKSNFSEGITRAESIWGENYPSSEGIPDERRIEKVNLYLLPTDGDQPFSPVALIPEKIQQEAGVYTYRVKLDLSERYLTSDGSGNKYLNGRIMALVNYPYEGIPALPLEIPAFDINDINKGGGIPMWGVTLADKIELRNHTTVDIGEIRLLRSVPKISISLHDSLKDRYKIISISASSENYSLYANQLPTGAEHVYLTQMLSIEGCFNPVRESSATGLTKFYGLGTDEVFCYPAERTLPGNSNGEPEYLNVTIGFKDESATFSGKVYLCDYSNRKPDFSTAFNCLVRNHEYRYVISLSQLEFLISFEEWKFGGKVHIELE